MKYFYAIKMGTTFEESKQRTVEALKEEGFGVLTEIDVKKILKEKLNVEFYHYQILGACNPQMAYEALQVEDKIGILLPCNVILQQKDPDGLVEVSIIDPIKTMDVVGNESLMEIAKLAEKKLKNVSESLQPQRFIQKYA